MSFGRRDFAEVQAQRDAEHAARREASRASTAAALCATPARTLHRAVYDGGVAAAAPKPIAKRNPHLLAMAKGRGCNLLAVHNCRMHETSTTVACHGNSAIFGKGGARKADDQYVVYGCAPCHEWLDRSGAPKAEKFRAFMAGHLRQVNEWRAIASNVSQSAADRKAAQWALDHLNATPVGETA